MARREVSEEAAELYRSGMTVSAVARKMKIGKHIVRECLTVKGVELRKRGRPLSPGWVPAPRYLQMYDRHYKDGKSMREIGLEFGGVSKQFVAKMISDVRQYLKQEGKL